MKLLLPFLVITLTLSFLTLRASASPGVALIEEWEGGQWGPIALDGDLLYAAGYSQFLLAIDVSDPANPTRIGNLLFPDRIQDIAVSGQYAYIAANDAGVRIIDLSQPSSLIEVRYNDGLRAECIDVSGDYAFAGQPNAGLHVLDVSNPAAPTMVGFVAYTGDQPDHRYDTASGDDLALTPGRGRHHGAARL